MPEPLPYLPWDPSASPGQPDARAPGPGPRAPAAPAPSTPPALTRQTLDALVAALGAGFPGQVLQRSGQLLAAHPDTPILHNIHGAALASLGRLQEARDSYLEAIRLRPDYAEAHNNLGNAFHQMGDTPRALASYRTALRLRPAHAQAHYNLGLALMGNGQLEAASASFATAVALEPGMADAWFHDGLIRQELGQLELAAARYASAVCSDPGHAQAHRHLAALKQFRPGDAQVAQMRSLLHASGLDDTERMHLCFALGQALDETGEVAEAFKLLDAANRLRRALHGWNDADDAARFARVQAQFAGALPALPAGHGSLGGRPCPILIVGMFRSGSSLVEQILDCHGQVRGAGELGLLEQAIRDAGAAGAAPPDAGQLERIRRHYLGGLSRLADGAAFVTDKQPGNFFWLGHLLAAVPEAKVVHTVRDARATCWSMFRNYFADPGSGYSCDQRDLAAHYRRYAGLMAHWQRRFPGRVIDLQYEALTEGQEAQTRALLAALGLGWEPACLEFHRNPRVVKTASALQVRQPMYQGSSQAWRRYAAYLGPLIEGLAGL